MTASLFLLGNVICSPFVYPLASKLGLRYLVILACLLMTLGTFIRMFINDWFIYAIIGQMIIGASVCFIINIQIQFCYNWFHPLKRPLFISLVSVLNIFGGGIGNLIPLIFVSSDQKIVDVIKLQMHTYTEYIFFATAFVSLLTIFLFRESPPPGYGSAK